MFDRELFEKMEKKCEKHHGKYPFADTIDKIGYLSGRVVPSFGPCFCKFGGVIGAGATPVEAFKDAMEKIKKKYDTEKSEEEHNMDTAEKKCAVRETTLKDTVEGMCSDDYKDRFEAEYDQLSIRISKLRNMISRYKDGNLEFIPASPVELLEAQLNAMNTYQECLRARRIFER